SGARHRLERATRAFDMTVERVWRAYECNGPAVSAAVLNALQLLGNLAARDATTPPGLAERNVARAKLAAEMRDALATLAARHHRLAALGFSFLKDFLTSDSKPWPEYWLDLWRRSLAELSRAWPEQGAERVKRLRRELDAATT